MEEPTEFNPNEKMKEIRNSRLMILIPTTKFVGENGEKNQKVEWMQPAGEISFGSIANPKNGHILGFKWEMPQVRKPHPFEGLFRNLFGGGD